MNESSFDYSAAPWPIREDLAASNRRAWARLAAPGRWWTGAQRIAIAAEVRAARGCTLCSERKQALSPFSLEGEHQRPETTGASSGDLSSVAVDTVHRLVTDPGRLTRSWFEALARRGLEPEPYVEIVGVVTTVFSIDVFHEALGLPFEALPAAQRGEPSRVRPDGLTNLGAYVPMIPASKARGREADLYRGAPFTGNVIAAMSLVPECVRQLQDLSLAYYMDPAVLLDTSRGGENLTRPQIELIAGRVSALNECFY